MKNECFLFVFSISTTPNGREGGRPEKMPVVGTVDVVSKGLRYIVFRFAELTYTLHAVSFSLGVSLLLVSEMLF